MNKCELTLKNMGTLLTSNRTALLFLVKEIHIQTPKPKSNPNSTVKEQQAGVHVQRALFSLSNQECLLLIKPRELISICGGAVDSSRCCKKYKNNLIWLVNYPKIRAAKALEPGYPSKNLWMNSHSQSFLHLLLR